MKPTEKFINKITSFSNVTIHSLWDTVYTGQFTLSPDLHAHYNYEVQVCIKGQYNIDCESKKQITLKENEICLIPIGYLHGTVAINDLPQKLALRFYIKKSAPSGCFHSLKEGLNACKEPVKLYSPQITVIIKEIHSELSLRGKAQSTPGELLLVMFFARLFKQLINDTFDTCITQSIECDDANSRAYKIERFFAEHYAEQITENTLAAHLNLSLRQTTRAMQQFCNTSFRNKLTEVRMLTASKLLLRTDMHIHNIAFKVGYTSSASFCTTFKKYFGMTPTEYKRRGWNKQPYSL